MAVKFLDDTGLGYFWGKIKAWCNATFAAITHNQASNTINAMTSYSKPSSGSAITTSDSLNTAIGKLEAKVDAVDDSNYVHLTGDESIAGAKTFTYNIYINKSSPTIVAKDSNITRGVVPSNTTHKDLFVYRGTADDNIYRFYYTISKNSGNSLSILAYPISNTNNTYIQLGLGYDDDGIAYATAPSTNSSRTTSTDILTRDWIPKDTRIVHTSGNEDVAGVKTFTDPIYINRGSPLICYINKGFTKGSVPSANMYWEMVFYDKNGPDIANQVGQIYMRLDKTNYNQHLILQVVDPRSAGSTTATGVELTRTNSLKAFYPLVDNGIRLGLSETRWSVVYAATASINTSDERLKSYINDLSESVLNAWDKIEFHQFKFNDSIEEKGTEHARIHVGLIAQEIDRIFKDYNLNASDYGLFCYDSWDSAEAVYNDSGNLEKEAVSAGDRYSLRYEEALCVEAAYQRRKNKILENRISELERQVSDMLQILQSLKGAN